MAHHVTQSAYGSLIDRINKFPQGAPPSALLNSILQLLFSEKEAALVALLPIRPFTAAKAAAAWSMSESGARAILDGLSSRALLVDTEENGTTNYFLPPPMAGFFEFSMMRLRGDVDQKALAELFYQYLNVEEEFIRTLFTDGETQLGRVFVHEPALRPENTLQVLDYERASEVIKNSPAMAVGMCYCRHKMQHMGRACDAPMDICMTFGGTASSLARHEYARLVDVSEGLDLLQQAYDNNLVQFGENVREGVNFICNCCGCCCEAMIASRRFALLHPVHTTNFVPKVRASNCRGCSKCVEICPVEAMTMISAHDPRRPAMKKARVSEEICLGCGVCARACPADCIDLVSRPERVITPANGAHRAVMMAIERGKLQNLIFDNQAHWNHRAMAAILGAILKLPPLQQALASRQMKSRYLETLLKRAGA